MSAGFVAVVFATAVATGCSGTGRTFPIGTELVFINRTLTPIEVQAGFIGACSEKAFSRADLDRAFQLRKQGVFPDAPEGTVDLTESAWDAPEMPKPLIIVIKADGAEQGLFGAVDDSRLPPCEGKAAAPEYRP